MRQIGNIVMVKLLQSIAKVTPRWAILLATSLRCLWRCWHACQHLPYRHISNLPALIIAPHPDDETFGCGGLMKLKRAAGMPVRVVILTDGEAVASGLGEHPDTVAAARKRETLNACQRLGVGADAIRWLHLPDGHLPHSGQAGFDEAARVLLTIIEEFSPGEVYCPHLLDGHRDHIAANHLSRQAARLWSKPCAVFTYPVWMWYHASYGLHQQLHCAGTWRLDISEVLPDKKNAMAAYLDATKTSRRHPYCGRLPWAFLQNFRRKYEIFFPATSIASSMERGIAQLKANGPRVHHDHD